MRNTIFCLTALFLVITPILAQSTNNVSVNALLAYNKWKSVNKRTYFSTEEQQFRQQIFIENFQKIEDHNANKNSTYKKALNQFSDMPIQEFKNKVLMKDISKLTKSAPPRKLQETKSEQPAVELPSSMDWRDFGIMTEVKKQGDCGSCYAFSVTGILEAFHYIKYQQKINLSEQQMIDCAGLKGYGIAGCYGGQPMEALMYVAEYGLVKQEEYPYTGVDGDCKFDKPTDSFKISSFYQLESKVEVLKDAVARLPVSVSVDASKWRSYSTGVFNDCGETKEGDLNHAVVAIGYDQEGNWIVRNSWGTTWGEGGYIKLAPGNTCGILYSPIVATF